jgi:hypothetical protein
MYVVQDGATIQLTDDTSIPTSIPSGGPIIGLPTGGPTYVPTSGPTGGPTGAPSDFPIIGPSCTTSPSSVIPCSKKQAKWQRWLKWLGIFIVFAVLFYWFCVSEGVGKKGLRPMRRYRFYYKK